MKKKKWRRRKRKGEVGKKEEEAERGVTRLNIIAGSSAYTPHA
jgi:hypothetical protein